MFSVAIAAVFSLWAAAGARGDVDAQLQARVERVMAQLAHPDPAMREKADVLLRNLPLEAYPLITGIFAKEKENLDPEARLRIEQSLEMFKALAVIDQREREHWRWVKDNSLKAYDAAGEHNAKWDEPVREAIAIATTWPRDASQVPRMRAACAKANAAGCNDPLFLYHYALFYSTEPDATEQKAMKTMKEAALKIATQECAYPAWLKCMVALRCKVTLLERPQMAAAIGQTGPLRLLQHPFMLFNQMIKPEDKLPPRLLYELAEMISHGDFEGDRMLIRGYEQVAKPFERHAPGSPYLHVLKGICYARYAFNAGDEFRVGQPVVRAAEHREERLSVAQSELEKAYEMDPQLAIVPREMLRLLFRRGAQREEIEKWFKRALAVNPDNYEACGIMLSQLATEEKLDFGRQCLAGQNWRGRLPFILVQAHEAMANAAEDKNEYWQRPQVWKDVRQLYETYLQLSPDSVEDRSNYALLANRCEQWAEADQQFKILGEKPSLKVFGSMASYNYQRKKAAKNAAAEPERRAK